MAVTQQLARLTAAQVVECRGSVEALHSVCSFTMLPACDYLDLNWYPNDLLVAARQAGVEPQLVAALNYACEGQREVNPAYREVPESIWEHPVNYLSPVEVVSVASDLHRLAQADFARQPLKPKRLEDAFSDLVGFYAEAAKRSLAIMMWWD